VGILVAGTLADLDLLSSFFGPAAYLRAHRAFSHSLLAAVAIIALAALTTLHLSRKEKQSLAVVLAATTCAALAHIFLDLLQSDGVALLWPFKSARFAADVLPGIDPWILFLLLAGVALPELFRLVGSEIGVAEKSPRGRGGALTALSLMVLYIAARAILHANSLALLEPHSYRGESPHRMASFPDALSPFVWHGLVETQSLVCEMAIPVAPGSRFDPEAGACLHKPDASPTLSTAQSTPAARLFLESARFPRATVEKTLDGYLITLRAAEDHAQEAIRHRVAAQILLDNQSQLRSQRLIWSAASPTR
jgi:membrane-bound metal-dependent hydrolase YbcI (DUF457 family)